MVQSLSDFSSIKRPIWFLFLLFVILSSLTFAIIKYKNKTKIVKMDENETDFYIHLKSDVRLTSPLMVGNTIGNFITRLNRKYNLSDEYKVALSRLHYTKSWYNVEGNHVLWLTNIEKELYKLDEEFPAGNYISVEEIVDFLNRIYRNFVANLRDNPPLIESPPEFEYNKYSNSIRVKLGVKSNATGPNRYLYPVLTPYLARFLGMSDYNGRQYPIVGAKDQDYGLIIKKRRKDGPSGDYLIHQQYQQQVNQLSVNMKDFTENVMKFMNKYEDKKILPNETKDTSKQQKSNQTSQNNSQDRKIIRIPSDENLDRREYGDAPAGQRDSNSTQNDASANADVEEIGYTYAFKQVNLHGYINNLNIYCNLLKPVSVGDVDVPLLRSVAVNPEDAFGKYVEYEPHIREYVPLLYHEFENIEIDIKSDEDKTIDFKFGQVYLSLHFRKSNINS